MGEMTNKKRIKINRIIIAIILILLVVVVLVPYFWMVSNSFKTKKESLTEPEKILPSELSLRGYERVLYESPFFKWLTNSLIITTTNTLAVLFTSSLLGFVFSKYRFRSRNAMFSILLATMMVPAQATMIPTFIMINWMGLYNQLGALIVPALFSVFGIYLCKQFIDEIPGDLLDSARIDGAGDLMIYFKIVLPQIRPALGALAIFTFLEHWNDYLRPLIYLNSTEQMTLPLALSYFATQHGNDLPATMAAAALIMIPVTIVFLVLQKQFIKGISLTGMK